MGEKHKVFPTIQLTEWKNASVSSCFCLARPLRLARRFSLGAAATPLHRVQERRPREGRERLKFVLSLLQHPQRHDSSSLWFLLFLLASQNRRKPSFALHCQSTWRTWAATRAHQDKDLQWSSTFSWVLFKLYLTTLFLPEEGLIHQKAPSSSADLSPESTGVVRSVYDATFSFTPYFVSLYTVPRQWASGPV